MWGARLSRCSLAVAAGLLLASVGAMSALAQTSNTWASIASMSTPREHPMAVTAGSLIYVMGGQSDSAVLASMEAYNYQTNSWTPKASMLMARVEGAAARAANGFIYVFGGYNASSTPLSDAEVYNPSTNSWSEIAPMPTPRGSETAVTGPNGLIYVIGGYNAQLGNLRTVEAYNPSTNKWNCSVGDTSTGCSNTSIRYMPTLRAAPAAAVSPSGSSGLIYVIGGVDNSGNALDVVEAYNPSTNSWVCSRDDASYGCSSSTLAAMPTARYALGAATGNNNVIYAVGGTNSSNTNLSANEAYYNYATNTWTVETPLPSPRHGPGVAKGPDGRIYAIGGGDPPMASGVAYQP